MILYVSPDQMIPLTGVLGTLVGLALMFWGKLQEVFRKLVDRFSSRNPERP